jgi:hypothetical protein
LGYKEPLDHDTEAGKAASAVEPLGKSIDVLKRLGRHQYGIRGIDLNAPTPLLARLGLAYFEQAKALRAAGRASEGWEALRAMFSLLPDERFRGIIDLGDDDDFSDVNLDIALTLLPAIFKIIAGKSRTSGEKS